MNNHSIGYRMVIHVHYDIAGYPANNQGSNATVLEYTLSPTAKVALRRTRRAGPPPRNSP